MDETNKEKPISKFDANMIEKSHLSNKMNIMNFMMNQMDMNKMMMNNSMMNQMDMNNQMDPLIMNNMVINNQMPGMQMMNQIQNNNQISGQEKINDKDNREISLIFYTPKTIGIQCLINEKVLDVIQRYRAKSGDRDPTKKFIFAAKNLNTHLTVAEAGLSNNAVIFVLSTKPIKGAGYSMKFTDLIKNKTKEIRFSEKAPSYRKITKGINIFGICNFKKCKAYKKEVVVRIKKKKLDLIKERDELFCPECEATIIPKTVGFYLCKFRIYGKKIEDDLVKPFENEKDEANNKDSLKYFDPELNGEVIVTELIFEVLEYL